jgi:hypothetical protein
MPGEIKLVVVDAAPLITLAAVQSLDYLLYPELPLIIPDAVFHEATAAAGKLGTQTIIDWYREHIAAVRVEPTRIFRDEMIVREAIGGRLSRDLGERAALEVVRDTNLLRPDELALLLSDDRDVQRLVVADPERTVLLTTWDYLRQLEEARRIQSAEAVIDAVRASGRNPPERDLFKDHPAELRDQVQRILRRSDKA